MKCSTTTSTRRLMRASVSIALANSGRFWPSVVSAKAGLMRIGIAAPNMTTNGAIAQLMCSPNRFDDPPEPAPERDLGVRDRVLDDVRDVGHAPRPAPRLEVLLGHAAPVAARPDRIAVDRDEQRYGAESVAVAEVALPVEPAVLGDRVGRPVADVVDEVQRRRVRAEALELLRQHAAPHLELGEHSGEEALERAAPPRCCCGSTGSAGRAGCRGSDRSGASTPGRRSTAGGRGSPRRGR